MNKKKIIMMSALLLVLFVVVAGITYAVYTFTGNSGLNTIDLGRISMSYTEPSNAYILENALPMTDEEGKGQNNYFEFTVTSHATTKESDGVGITIPYEINISDIAIDEGMLELSKSLMKVNLVKVDGMTENEVVVPTLMSSLSASTLNTGASVIYQANDTHKNGSTTITSKYRLRAWITEGFDVSDTDNTYQYKFRVNVNSNMDSLKPNATGETKLLTTAIMDQGVVSSGNGLYMSTATNDGTPTYYYHGAVENNYVQFGGKELGNCTYNGNLLVDASTGIYADKNSCAQATSVCDAHTVGETYLIGIDEEICTGNGATYIEVKPQWNDQVCYYKGEMVVNYTGDGTDLSAGNVPENECLAITEICDARTDGFGYVAGVTEEFCKAVAPNAEYITVEETPSFGQNSLLWRVIRINEDGTTRLILNKPGTEPSYFNTSNTSYKNAYYSESNIEGGAKKVVLDWYDENLASYDSMIATSTFCEQAKVTSYPTSQVLNKVTLTSNENYTPTFECENDANGYGLILDQKVGLMTLDEILHANGNNYGSYGNFYLVNEAVLTMSPGEMSSGKASVWVSMGIMGVTTAIVAYNIHPKLHPVISLNANIIVSGDGTIDSPWIVQK